MTATRAEYAPKPRIVVEVLRPRVLRCYVDGVETEMFAQVRTDRGRFWVEFEEDSHPALPKGVGPAQDIEVVFADD